MWAETAKKLGAAAFWLLIWQALALAVHNSIALAGPWETVLALFSLLPTGDFWLAVGGSALRIIGGFLLGSALGVLLAALAYRFRPLRTLLAPLMGALKAVPVASFVILALISLGSSMLALLVTFTVSLPILYLATLEGLGAADGKLLELAAMFRMGLGSRIRGIYLPALVPGLRSALALASGMAWKSGIAAEVIGQTAGTLGNELYRAKIYLETDKVLAVTLTAVALAWLTGKLVLLIFDLWGGGDRD